MKSDGGMKHESQLRNWDGKKIVKGHLSKEIFYSKRSSQACSSAMRLLIAVFSSDDGCRAANIEIER